MINTLAAIFKDYIPLLGPWSESYNLHIPSFITSLPSAS